MPHLRSVPKTVAIALAICGALPVCGQAQAIVLDSGEYITELGWGVLTISHSGQTTHFSLQAMGPNAHVCGLGGDIQGDRAILATEDPFTNSPGPSCVVTFQVNAEGIAVSDDLDQEACRYFCGMRAHFEGEYLRPEAGCTGEERRSTRERFRQLYASKSYAAAADTLETLLARCAKTLNQEAGWIQNDLAVTQYHLGRLSDCQKSLASLAEDAAKTDEELRQAFLPSDFDAYFPILQATRHNLRLCSQYAP